MQPTTIVLVFALVSLACLAHATQVKQCQGQNYPDLSNNVVINTCKKPPCKLKRKTTTNVEIKFEPSHDVKSLTTHVYAEVAGLPLPFIGVDGISACNKIFEEDGVTKADCPLSANKKYVYKNSFPILEIYPRISTLVHWSLGHNNKDVVCFEVDARIV